MHYRVKVGLADKYLVDICATGHPKSVLNNGGLESRKCLIWGELCILFGNLKGLGINCVKTGKIDERRNIMTEDYSVADSPKTLIACIVLSIAGSTVVLSMPILASVLTIRVG